MVVEFRARRDLIVDGLNAIPGIRCLRPTGAFYAFPDISGTGLTGAELADRLLHEAGVCVLAGTAFGGVGTNHIRISYANSRENLTLGAGADRRVRASRSSPRAAAPADGPAARSSSRGGSRTTGIDADRRRRPTRPSGRTSCRRRATSCSARSPAATAS